jgi:transposase-like protein
MHLSTKRRKFSGAEKVAILRRHLVEDVPVSDLCDEYKLNPNVFYRWQKTFFENGASAFAHRRDAKSQRQEKHISALNARLSKKDEIIAEIMAEQLSLKKSLGEI